MLTINAETDIVDQGGIYALVGPTGVGKTTTTAKLAARCVLRHGARKLALVTTDGYRIGAHEQLRIYGRILGVPVHLARDAKALQATLRDLQHTHMVLIDTMGMSQRDRMVSEQVAMFGDTNIRSLLLLSATSRGDTLDDVVRSYSGLGLSGCILTKVDEAASLASSLDVIIRHNLRMYYVSNGQRVPEDLHLPHRPYLLHRAFKDLPESSPHRLAGVEPGLMMANSGAGGLSAGGQCG
jgi:flagellar biosynthesis protein FlhF